MSENTDSSADDPGSDSTAPTWATFSGEMDRGKVSNTLGYYWSAVYGVKFSLVSPLELSLTLGMKFVVVAAGPSISFVLGPLYWARYSFAYWADVGSNYSQTIKGSAFKNVRICDYTVGGLPIPGGTAVAYKAQKVKYEVYNGSTYKWIKGGKYEKEGLFGDTGAQGSNDDYAFVNDTGSKTFLGTSLEHFVTTKAASDAAKTSWSMTPQASTLSSPAITFTAPPAGPGAPAGLGTFVVNAATRTATIGTPTNPGNCTETINGTKTITATVGTTAGLKLTGTQASLVAGTSGLSISTAMVTIGPQVSLGQPVPAIVAGAAGPPQDNSGTVNQKLAELEAAVTEAQSEAEDAYDLAWETYFLAG